MASIQKFEELEAWQSARKLASEIYTISSSGGFAKDFTLTNQIRRAVVSTVSNIAEGFERGGNQEFLQFLSIAKGSTGEVRAQLYIALDQGYVDRVAFDQLQDLAGEVSGKLGGLIAYFKASGKKGSKYRVDEPGTLNPELGTPSRQGGFSIVMAIFLIVVLSALGVYILSVTGVQQASQALDVQGVRAYQAARAGIEWGAFQVLDPNNALGAALPACPASPTHLTSLAGSLSTFTVTVTCTASDATEGNRNIRVFGLTATGCNSPGGGPPASCPAATGTGYVERQLQATLSKCKDPTAAAPRFACG